MFQGHRFSCRLEFYERPLLEVDLTWLISKAWYTTHKRTQLCRGIIRTPILPQLSRSHPQVPERYHPFTCICLVNLVQISWGLRKLFPKDRFFGPQSDYPFGWKPLQNRQKPVWLSAYNYLGVMLQSKSIIYKTLNYQTGRRNVI